MCVNWLVSPREACKILCGGMARSGILACDNLAAESDEGKSSAPQTAERVIVHGRDKQEQLVADGHVWLVSRQGGKDSPFYLHAFFPCFSNVLKSSFTSLRTVARRCLCRSTMRPARNPAWMLAECLRNCRT